MEPSSARASRLPDSVPTAPLLTAASAPAFSTLVPLLAEASDGIEIFDVKGNLVYANQAAADFWGYATPGAYLAARPVGADGALPRRFKDAAGRSLPPEQSPWEQAMRGQALASQSLSYVDQQGGDRWAAIQSVPLCDEAGTVAYGAVISRALPPPARPQQTQPLSQLAEAVPSWVACLDRQERHCYANQAYRKAFGEQTDALTGKSLLAVVGPGFYHPLRAALAQALHGEAVDLCVPLSGPHGQVHYKQVNLIPQGNGSVVEGVYLVVNDITAHRHTAALLQTETNFFRHALEAASVGIWEWNFETNEMMWSSPQERLFGLAPGTFDGQPETFFALVDERDRDGLHAAIDRALQPPGDFAAEFRVPLPTGGQRWLSHRGQGVRDALGRSLRLVGVTVDITAQKEADARLQQQVQRDHLIAKIAQHISQPQDLEAALPQVMQQVRHFLNLDRLAMIDLRDKMAGKVIFEDHCPAVEAMLTWEIRHPWALKESFLSQYRQGRPVVVANVHEQALDSDELGFLAFFQIAADLTVPLLEDKKLWGLLSAQARTPREWQPEECRLLETLGMLISNAVQRDRLHRNLTKANQQLKRYAYLDGLTQVANRRRFEQFIHHEWRRLMREKAPLALIMADIDHFKAYNDIY
ncbi:MAG TPA: PAS domain-containing protein, partial [Candidatus Obscuribacterales bacterium]